MSLSTNCSISQISISNCRLLIKSPSGAQSFEFELSDTIIVNQTSTSFVIKDDKSQITITKAMLPSINSGAFSTLQSLIDFIRVGITDCTCSCSTPVIPIVEIEATDVYTMETSTYTIPAGQRYVYIVNEGITAGTINGTNINVGGHFTFEMKTDLLGNLIVSPEYIIDATGTEFQIHYYK